MLRDAVKLPPKRVRDRFKGKQILIAWAEPAAGPGWSNSPVWIITRDKAGKLSQECLQPDECNKEIRLLYSVNERASAQMTAHVRYWLGVTP